MKDYLFNIKDILSGGSDRNPYWLQTDVPFEIIEETVKKLKEIKEFYQGEEGEKFMKAVLDKTKYADEYKKQHEKEIKKGILDESYFDAVELTNGLLAQVTYSAKVLLDELQKDKDKYLVNKSEKLNNYELILLELEKII